MTSRLSYFVGETVINLRRNTLLTLAAISTVTISLLLVGSVMVGGEILNKAFSTWEGKVELNVFLRDEITPDQFKQLDEDISSVPEVQLRYYESKEAAFKEYTRMFKDSPALTDNIEPDALPASFRIKLKDPITAKAVAARINGRPGVDGDVQFGGETLERLLKFIGVVKTGLFVAIGLTVGAAILLIANTIRLGIYARRREIRIMKLVGATNWFIRVPFIFEGITHAVLGAVAGSGVIWAGKEFGLDRAQESILFLPITIGGGSILKIFLALLGAGVVIGAIGSTLALRRFLEV